MIRLSESEEQHIKDYVSKYKCKSLKSDWDKKWSLKERYHYYSAYHLSLLFGKKAFTQTSEFFGYLKKLDQTRELYQSLDNYKDAIKNAKSDYKDAYTLLAQAFENKILDVYEEVRDKIEIIKDGYLEKSKEIYKEIHDKYPGVNDIDVGIYEDLHDIVNNIHKAFESTSVKLMKNIDPKYKGLTHKKINIKSSKKKEDYTELFEHCKILFDVDPELERIRYFSIYKAYDAPYNIGTGDILDITEDTIYEYEEKYGQGSFSDWADKYYKLIPDIEGDPKDYGDDLYPGYNYNFYITRDFEFTEEENEE